MKMVLFAVWALLLCIFSAVAEMNAQKLAGLTSRVGETFWSAPEKRLVRATTYKRGREAEDPLSGKGQSDGRCALRYASAAEAGTLAVPAWLPRGSMIKIHTNGGVLSYVAADQGRHVEARVAAKVSGQTEEEKSAPVLDFCAGEQVWPDFVIVDIYYYAGKVPFEQLTEEEQKTLFAYAMEYVRKRE